MVWDIVKIGIEDVEKVFNIQDNLYQKYVEDEIKKDKDLLNLINFRDSGVDWQKETPLGGMGTTLNACVLYCLVRYYGMSDILETGVSGGYYSSFILSALSKSKDNSLGPMLKSLEISNDEKEIGKLVPESLKNTINVKWDKSFFGLDSLEYFRNLHTTKTHHEYDMYCHDSLHTMAHMTKELNEFKQSQSNMYFIFIDDEKSDNFWTRSLQTNAFKRNGYSVKWISGNESRLKGHLGGFIFYVKS